MEFASTPTIATHYHAPHRRPFLNLSDLDGDDLDRVLSDLSDERRRGTNKRVFGRFYMGLRLEAEAKMRELFRARGGVVERDAPHYFVLGFRLGDIDRLVDRFGLPGQAGPAYDGYERALMSHFVEIQLWSDEPVRAFR